MVSKEAEKYKEKGNAEFKAGNHAKAIEFYTYATELDPKSPIYFTNRSNAYFLMKNYEKSLRDATKAVKCESSWAKGHYRMGVALMEMDRAKDALVAFEQAANMDSKNQTFAKSVVTAKRALMKGMSNAEIIKTEGNEAFKAGKIEDAVKIYGRALAAVTSTEKDLSVKADCFANRAACYRQLYLPEECIKDCTALLEINPKHVKGLIRRAQAYESMEKYQKALDDFVLASRVDPSARIAYEGSSRLRTAMARMGSGKN